MNSLLGRILCLLALLLGCAGQAFGAGYAVYEWSARGNALGGALTARADDPSAIAYNPAGITQLPGIQVSGGATFIIPNAHMDVDAEGTDGWGKQNVWVLPNGYYTHQLSDNIWAGVGIFSRVGLGTEYEDPDTWAGRYNVSYAGIKASSLAPTMAFKLNEKFSFAVGVEAMFMDFEYHKYTDVTGQNDPGTTSTDVKQEIHCQGWAPGWNLSLHYKPTDWLAFGALYRSKIELTVEGDAEFDRNPGADATIAALKASGVPSLVAKGNYLDAALQDTDIEGTEPIPASLTVGVMVKPMNKLTIEVDAVYTQWSAYDELVFEYDNVLGDKGQKKSWNDTMRYQIGVEYALKEWCDLRAGYVWDESPIEDRYEDYAIPANDRQIFTVGAGFHQNAWALDVSYGYLWMKGRDYDARPSEGIYDSRLSKGHSHLIGLNFTYEF